MERNSRGKISFLQIYRSSEVAELLRAIAVKRANGIPKVSPSVGRGYQVATSPRCETSGKFRHRSYCGLCLGKQRAREPLLRPKSGKVHRDFDSVASRAQPEAGKQVLNGLVFRLASRRQEARRERGVSPDDAVHIDFTFDRVLIRSSPTNQFGRKSRIPLVNDLKEHSLGKRSDDARASRETTHCAF